MSPVVTPVEPGREKRIRRARSLRAGVSPERLQRFELSALSGCQSNARRTSVAACRQSGSAPWIQCEIHR